jgi:hypothetical protein
MPVFGMTGRSFAGSTLGDPWFAVEVLNEGIVAVTVTSVAIEFEDGGNAPFLSPPWPGADALPKRLEAGEEATFVIDELRKVAQVHAEHGGARRATAKCSGREFYTETIKKTWLDGWVPKTEG